MAKKRRKVDRYSMVGFDAAHYRSTQEYVNAVNALFDRATHSIASAAARGKYDPDKPFSFRDYPEMREIVQKVTAGLTVNMKSVVERGSRNQWLYACEKNDEFIGSIMNTSKVSKARLNKMQDRNLDALSTFQGRKVGGMDLSKRVWNYVGQYKDQIELGLDVGLGEGRSAAELSRDLRQNLKDPDRLFRRVRDKHGNLQLSKAAKAFNPGQGVYRSSYMNAMRLTRSEINMSYREADWLRWQQLDFVVGFEVRVSNRHEEWLRNVWNKKNPGKIEICDQLKGRYPKTFKFKGWHPQCMCYCVPILMDEETFDKQELSDLKSALNGTEYKKYESKDAVTEMPAGFNNWVDENMERQKKWRSAPYFVRDNFKYGQMDKGLRIDLPAQQKPPIDPVEAEKSFIGYIPLLLTPKQKTEWIKNHKEIEEKTGVTQGQEMTFDEANELRGNENYTDALTTPKEYRVNCQSCVVANELRRRGFDVTAQGNTGKKDSIPNKLSYQTQLAWIDPKTGEMPKKQKAGGISGMDSLGRIRSKTLATLNKELDKLTMETGRYHLDMGWKGSRSGHIVTAERAADGKLRIYDPQNGKMVDWSVWQKRISLRHGVGVLRVDGLHVNGDIIKGVIRKPKKK